jgi:hypothetical protein
LKGPEVTATELALMSEQATVNDALSKPFTLAEKFRLALEIVGVYVEVRIWLVRRELPAAVAALRSVDQPIADEVGMVQQATGYRLGRVVGRTLSKLPADSRCLVRSLVLSRLLARRGIPASLVIGVKLDPEFAAHAWVESGGMALLPAGETEYGRLLEL